MQIDQIIEHFKKNGIPKGPIRYNQCTVIHDPAKMVESHIRYLKQNPKKKHFLPYYKSSHIVFHDDESLSGQMPDNHLTEL